MHLKAVALCYTLEKIATLFSKSFKSITISGHVVSSASGLVVLQQDTGTEKLLNIC